MLTGIQWTYLCLIVACSLVGGVLPLMRRERARGMDGFPKSEAFASGVFLALSLMMMLPASFAAFEQAYPGIHYPIASVIAIAAFLTLLAIEHMSGHLLEHERKLARESAGSESDLDENPIVPAVIPVIMTGMIAAPSFFLGAALGISDSTAASLIFVAVILHKGTAAFALALAMVRSNLTSTQAWVLFLLFCSSTPIGILAGSAVGQMQSDAALTVKAIVLALGAGTFLYMGTLHEMKRASLIEHCCKPSCFASMLGGLAVTALVRWIVGESHHF